jgi:hypothetical protein
MMKRFALLAVTPLLLGQAAPHSLGSRIWTKEEDRYFAQERKAVQVPEWKGFEIATNGSDWRRVDPCGKPLTDWRKTMLPAGRNGDRFMTRTDSGIATELRRGRPCKCWAIVRRNAAKPDGSEDWSLHFNLTLQDQGGRALVEPRGAPPVLIRLRNVIWPPPSTNNPSLVLYIYKPDQLDRAVSYGWADPDARRLGINLRWVQANCIREEGAS